MECLRTVRLEPSLCESNIVLYPAFQSYLLAHLSTQYPARGPCLQTGPLCRKSLDGVAIKIDCCERLALLCHSANLHGMLDMSHGRLVPL